MMERDSLNTLLAELNLLSQQVLEKLYELDEDGLVAFVDRRAEIVDEMSAYRAHITEQDKEQIRQILEQEQFILHRMQAIREEAGGWLSNQGAIRVQQNAYQQTYAIDSLFIDHRK